MGLGKTLSVLALIAWFLDTLDNASLSQQASTPHTTLIVSPKSSKMQIILENISSLWILHTNLSQPYLDGSSKS